MSAPSTMDDLLTALQLNADATTRLLAAAEAIRQAQSQHADTVGGKAEIHINAGGIAVWACATFCTVCMVSVLFLAGVVYWSSSRTVDHGHQMNALYQSVPGLRELVERQMKLNEQTTQAQKEEPQQ